MNPEQRARVEIDRLLQAAGWHVCDVKAANIHANRGVAIREFPLDAGFGFADYMLSVDGNACGVIEAKKQGATLAGVETQSGRYSKGLPASLETHFTNRVNPNPRARNVFAFHRPEMLADWLRPSQRRRCWARATRPNRIDRSVQTPDQIGTIAHTLRDNWKHDLFPQRQEFPKTLVFAKDDTTFPILLHL